MLGGWWLRKVGEVVWDEWGSDVGRAVVVVVVVGRRWRRVEQVGARGRDVGWVYAVWGGHRGDEGRRGKGEIKKKTILEMISENDKIGSEAWTYDVIGNGTGTRCDVIPVQPDRTESRRIRCSCCSVLKSINLSQSIRLVSVHNVPAIEIRPFPVM